MHVWIMNLKDVRDAAKGGASKEKFDFCKENGIVGIGWVGYEEGETECIGYTRAKNAIEQFEPHDLVWVKDTEKGEYYICEISEQTEPMDKDSCENHDISQYRSCEYHHIGNRERLSECFPIKDLISVSTIQKANEIVTAATIDLFETLSESSKKQKPKNTRTKKIIAYVSLFCILCLFVIAYFEIIMPDAITTPATATPTSAQTTARITNGTSPSKTTHKSGVTFEEFYSECKRLYRNMGLSDSFSQSTEMTDATTYTLKMGDTTVIYVKTDGKYIKSVTTAGATADFFTNSLSVDQGVLLCKIMAVPAFAFSGENMDTLLPDILKYGRTTTGGSILYQTSSFTYEVVVSSGNITSLFSAEKN